MKINFSLDTAIIITLTSALLYMAGQIYLNSYLRPFGAEALVLNFSIQDKLYYGYLKTVNHWILFLFALIVIFIGLPVFIKELGIDNKIKNFFKKLRKSHTSKTYARIHNESSNRSFDQTIDSRIALLYPILFFIIFALFYLAHLERKTQEESQKIIVDFPAKLLKVEVKELDLKDPHKLLCGQSLCAIVSKNEQGNIILNYAEPKNITVTKEIK